MDWDRYWCAHYELAQAEHGGDPSAIEKEKKLLASLEVKLRNHGALESIQSHALIDMIFLSCDSHTGQYQFEEGELFNFDFSQFLPPGLCVQAQGDVVVPFRSAWVDHPFAKEPMSQELIKIIQSIDMIKLEEKWRSEGLIGDPQVFANEAQVFKEIIEDRKAINSDTITPEEVEELARKYHVSGTTSDEMIENLNEAFSRMKESIREKCFSQIHPKAFEQMKETNFDLKTVY